MNLSPQPCVPYLIVFVIGKTLRFLQYKHVVVKFLPNWWTPCALRIWHHYAITKKSLSNANDIARKHNECKTSLVQHVAYSSFTTFWLHTHFHLTFKRIKVLHDLVDPFASNIDFVIRVLVSILGRWEMWHVQLFDHGTRVHGSVWDYHKAIGIKSPPFDVTSISFTILTSYMYNAITPNMYLYIYIYSTIAHSNLLNSVCIYSACLRKFSWH